MESVLRVENLKYKDILKDVTFSLEEKTFNILVGPNGSGKTTLVNAIRGLIKYEGNIFLLNEIINEELYRQIGFFTDENIVLEDNLINELIFALKNLGYDEEKAKKRIFNLTKKLDIIDLLFKTKDQLTNCEKTFVSFVFSIIHEPKILIVDNDLENLNLNYKTKILNYIRSQKKITILFITNNSEYFNQTDNLLFFSNGEIVLNCKFDELVKKEKNLLKCGSNLPFSVELSNKLIAYELINKIELDIEKMVNEIWK